MSSDRKNWMILGGCGFIGRNLVSYLIENEISAHIRVVDKQMPVLSFMNARHKAVFDRKELVEFKQADLSKDDHVARAFKEYKPDYVVNLCGETRFGMSEQEYKTKCVNAAVKCGQAALQAGAFKFIEISTAQVYQSDKSPSNENSKLKPWTVLAKYRLEAEEALKQITGLNLVILRPAVVYGSADLTGITPRIACAAVYQKNKEKMKFLWDENLRVNVVHVEDVARAIILAAQSISAGSVFNLADQTDLTQGKLNGWLGEIFGIDIGFVNSFMSNLAKVNLKAVAEDANDKHVPTFTSLCSQHEINNTPISPFIDRELLSDNHLCVDGTTITKQHNFTYNHQINKELVRAQIEDFIQQGVFPPVI